MTAPTLTLEVVTPDGVALLETGVEVVVLRRWERRFHMGSEIAVYPRHGPLLVRMPVAPVRYQKEGTTMALAVYGGFAEVLNDRVVIVSPRCERVSTLESEPVDVASAGTAPRPAGT